MPYITTKYNVEFQNKTNKEFEKKVYFDILGGLPPLPHLPSNEEIAGEVKDEVEEMLKNSLPYLYIPCKGINKFITPFPHPIRMHLGTSHKNIREFFISIYAMPEAYCISKKNGDENYSSSYEIRWAIALRKRENFFNKIWWMEKYKKLYEHFPYYLFYVKDYTFFLHMFLLHSYCNTFPHDTPEFIDDITGTTISSKKYILDTIFPEGIEKEIREKLKEEFKKDFKWKVMKFPYDSINNVSFFEFFKKDEFPSFFIDPKYERDEFGRKIISEYRCLNDFQLNDAI